MENNNRPSWDEYFTNLINMTASRSKCDRLQVGCILVSSNNIIKLIHCFIFL